MAETADLKSVQCEFDSHLGHMKKPTFWVQLKALDMGFDAHFTLHWLGEEPTGNPRANSILSWVDRHSDYSTHVKPIDFAFFGPPDDIVPVVTLSIFDDLWHMKDELEEILPSPSEFTWKPHITLKGLGRNPIFIPEIIKLHDPTLEMKE